MTDVLNGPCILKEGSVSIVVVGYIRISKKVIGDIPIIIKVRNKSVDFISSHRKLKNIVKVLGSEFHGMLINIRAKSGIVSRNTHIGQENLKNFKAEWKGEGKEDSEGGVCEKIKNRIVEKVVLIVPYDSTIVWDDYSLQSPVPTLSHPEITRLRYRRSVITSVLILVSIIACLVTVVPNAKKFRYCGINLELEHKLDLMFMGVVATGVHAWTRNERIDHENVRGDSEQLDATTDSFEDTSQSFDSISECSKLK
ncbi:hypothetical protein IEQ34_017444 [Dendrobium chrysotoxum]|uniref:Uncharacterized protein n=1 Tax=Dendrobium chrysotoxum TaxID=161865 RepID=A0AAV7FTU4_DENCH|nr:hypothetical protein IEQ34_017444 [Dendrobium chrysotoxum]